LATREWFSPQRWSVNDALMAVAAIVLGGSVLCPWFRATVKFKTAPLVGSLIEPKGSESGIEAHRFLLAVGALALVELAVLIAQNAPDRHAVPNRRISPSAGVHIRADLRRRNGRLPVAAH
jgi:hypothetical protein